MQTATPVLYRSLAAAAVVAMRNTRGVAAFWRHIIVRLSHLREIIVLVEVVGGALCSICACVAIYGEEGGGRRQQGGRRGGGNEETWSAGGTSVVQ